MDWVIVAVRPVQFSCQWRVSSSALRAIKQGWFFIVPTPAVTIGPELYGLIQYTQNFHFKVPSAWGRNSCYLWFVATEVGPLNLPIRKRVFHRWATLLFIYTVIHVWMNIIYLRRQEFLYIDMPDIFPFQLPLVEFLSQQLHIDDFFKLWHLL